MFILYVVLSMVISVVFSVLVGGVLVRWYNKICDEGDNFISRDVEFFYVPGLGVVFVLYAFIILVVELTKGVRRRVHKFVLKKVVNMD